MVGDHCEDTNNPWGVEGGVLNGEHKIAGRRKIDDEATESVLALGVCEAASGWKRGGRALNNGWVDTTVGHPTDFQRNLGE